MDKNRKDDTATLIPGTKLKGDGLKRSLFGTTKSWKKIALDTLEFI